MCDNEQHMTKVYEPNLIGIIIADSQAFKHHYENALTRLSIVTGILHEFHRYVTTNNLREVCMSLGYLQLYMVLLYGE